MQVLKFGFTYALQNIRNVNNAYSVWCNCYGLLSELFLHHRPIYIQYMLRYKMCVGITHVCINATTIDYIIHKNMHMIHLLQVKFMKPLLRTESISQRPLFNATGADLRSTLLQGLSIGYATGNTFITIQDSTRQ